MVSDKFGDVKAIQRHRMVNEVLADELDGKIHALSLQLKTPEQWEKSGGAVYKSPPCLGGSKKA